MSASKFHRSGDIFFHAQLKQHDLRISANALSSKIHTLLAGNEQGLLPGFHDRFLLGVLVILKLDTGLGYEVMCSFMCSTNPIKAVYQSINYYDINKKVEVQYSSLPKVAKLHCPLRPERHCEATRREINRRQNLNFLWGFCELK